MDYFFIELFQFFMFQDISWIFWKYVQCLYGIYPRPSSSLLLLSALVYRTSLLGNLGNLMTFFLSQLWESGKPVNSVCILTREGWHGKIGGRSAKKHKGPERSAISCVIANSSGYNTDLLVTPVQVTKSPLKNRVMSFLCFNLEFIPFSPKIWIFFDS